MNIFIVGTTNTGKTTLAKSLSELWGIKHIQASKPLKELYHQHKDEDDDTFTTRITKNSLDLLRVEPNYFVDKIRKQFDEDNIIEGVRNVRDFMLLFNPSNDILIVTSSITDAKTKFEKDGIKLIYDCHEYMVNFLGISNAYYYKRDNDKTSKVNIENFLNQTKLNEYFS